MRKLILALISATALSLMGAVVAFADGGPHGGYNSATGTEDACAACHRAHAGFGRMLKANSVTGLCTSCHDGSVADTDVQGGTYMGGAIGHTGGQGTNGAALNGGAFVTGVTSTHSLGSTYTTVPDATSKTIAGGLSCSRCHDPHGRRWNGTNLVHDYGANPSLYAEQYRMLVGYSATGYSSGDSAANVKVESNEGTTKSYTANNWKLGVNSFCTSCHDLDMQGRDTGYAGVAKHPVGVSLATYGSDIWTGWTLTTSLPTENPLGSVGSDSTVVCMTCHKPHGTTAVATGGYSSGVTPASIQTLSSSVMGMGITDTGNSYLLRKDNRGVCQDCHKK